MNVEEFVELINSYAAVANPKYPEDVWYEFENWFRLNVEVRVSDNATVVMLDSSDIDYSEDWTRAEPVWQVVKVKTSNESQYFRRDGTHASYVGTEWDAFREVHPVQKTITVFE